MLKVKLGNLEYDMAGLKHCVYCEARKLMRHLLLERGIHGAFNKDRKSLIQIAESVSKQAGSIELTEEERAWLSDLLLLKDELQSFDAKSYKLKGFDYLEEMGLKYAARFKSLLKGYSKERLDEILTKPLEYFYDEC